MGRAKFSFFFLALFAASAATSQNRLPSESAIQTVDTAQNSASEQIVALERENQRLTNEAAIAELRADLLAEQSSWFEIWTAVLMGGFSLVVTVVVIAFAFRFGKQAIEEAKSEAMIAAKAGIQEERDEVQKLLKSARSSVAKIKTHEKSAKELLEGIPTGELPEDEGTRQELREIAEEAQTKSAVEQTIDDYRARFAVASMEKDWKKAREISEAMQRQAEREGSEEDIADALFNRAYASAEMGDHGQAIKFYSSLIARFEAEKDPSFVATVAISRVNMGVSLRNVGRVRDAIVEYDIIISRYKNSTSKPLSFQVATAFLKKAVCLNVLGNPDKAIYYSEQAREHFNGLSLPGVNERIEAAIFNRACSNALLGRVRDTISSLQEWHAHQGFFDCSDILNDSDFDRVRDRPTFRKYLEKNGCDPDARPEPQ
ncbi:MAG: tetratricopeptide repeat protein [Pseudomonadota bacterium]